MKRGSKLSSKNKTGQLTIFVVVGLILVTGVLLFFVLRGDIKIPVGGSKEPNINSFLDSCIKDSVREASNEISLHGGYIGNPLSAKFQFSGEGYTNISYLCYTGNNFVKCVNQKPLLLKDLQDGIKNKISEEVGSCFDDAISNLQNDNYEVNSKLRDFEVRLMPGRIVIETDSEVTMEKNDESKSEEDFKIIIASKMYEIAGTVQEIVNQESRFCSFDISSFILTYPEYSIDRFPLEDSTLIYKIVHEETSEEFRFAVRGCVIPNI